MRPAVLLKRRIDSLNPKSPESDIIISTKLRVARDLKGEKFPQQSDAKSLENILNLVQRVFDDSFNRANYSYYRIHRMEEIARFMLVERSAVSLEFAQLDRPRGLFLFRGEGKSVMINEEDHLCFQTKTAGLDGERTWKMMRKLMAPMAEYLDYARNPRLGYLTSCPTNVGTGLRLSFQCHLPGLLSAERFTQVASDLITAGVNINGFFGEGSPDHGDIFQLSNKATLGISEEDTIRRTSSIISTIITEERNAREFIKDNRPLETYDRVSRAYAITTYAKLIGIEEYMKHLSALRLGLSLGWITGIDLLTLNTLLVFGQPAHIVAHLGAEATREQIDAFRAEMTHQRLENIQLV